MALDYPTSNSSMNKLNLGLNFKPIQINQNIVDRFKYHNPPTLDLSRFSKLEYNPNLKINTNPQSLPSSSSSSSGFNLDEFGNKYGQAIGVAGKVAGSLLSNGLSTPVGDLVNTAGTALSSIPGVGWALGAAAPVVGGLINGAFGYQKNQQNVDQAYADINSTRNTNIDTSSSAALLGSAQNMNTLDHVNKSDLGKEGWFVNKLGNLQNQINTSIDDANQFAQNKLANGVNMFNTNNVLSGLKNGNINAIGGEISTHGANFPSKLKEINSGGTHEQNPYDGVQMGSDEQGTPNLVEQGETVYDDKVFSNRIQVPKKDKTALGLNAKKKITYADASKELSKEAKERPNDPISNRGLNVKLSNLFESQEAFKQEQLRQRAISLGLDPDQVQQAYQQQLEQLQQPQQQPQEQQYEQYPQQEQQMENEDMMNNQQQPMMAFGGNLFKGGGKTKGNATLKYGYYGGAPEYKYLFNQNQLDLIKYLNDKNNQDVANGIIQKINKGMPKGHSLTANNISNLQKGTNNKLINDALNAAIATDGIKLIRYKNNNVNLPEATTRFTDLYKLPTIDGTLLQKGINQAKKEIAEQKAAYIARNQEPLPTWQRELPLYAGLSSVLTDTLGLTNKPDYTAANQLAGLAREGTFVPVRSNPIYQRYTYNPVSPYAIIDTATASSADARRALRYQGLGRMATANANMNLNNQLINNIGDNFYKAQQMNNAAQQQVGQLNYAVDKDNLANSIATQNANQSAWANSRKFTFDGLSAANTLRQAEQAAANQNRATNLNNTLTSWSNYGKENAYMNMINFNKALNNYQIYRNGVTEHR